MAKIMLVEDDNNLREIYEARLLAEGYEIVSAEDGEQALAMAVKEKPDLIISDIMMPKISGFDMLDILRSTPETKHTKIIMMTALSQAEDKERADKLGADKYLVKSQVTLEDVAKVTKEVLQDDDIVPADPLVSNTTTVTAPQSPPSASQPASTSSTSTPVNTLTATSTDTSMANTASTISSGTATTPNADTSTATQASPQPISTDSASVTPAPTTPAATSTADSTIAATNTAATMASTVNHLLQNDPVTSSSSTTNQTNETSHSSESNHVAIAGKKVISPINDLSAGSGPNLDALLAKEMGQTLPTESTTSQPSQQAKEITPTDTTSSTNEEPVDVPLPGNVQTPESSNNPSDIAL